jgi:hypothetical protein
MTSAYNGLVIKVQIIPQLNNVIGVLRKEGEECNLLNKRNNKEYTNFRLT